MNLVKSAPVLLLIAVLCLTCTSDQDNEVNEDAVSDIEMSNELEISSEAVKDVIRKIPSPLEMTDIVKGSGVYFSKEMLNSTDKIDNYSTSHQKALNLGIYGADLGCINIYGKTHLAIGYIDVVKTLAEDLKVGHFFDFATLTRLVDNKDNIDSLLYISTKGFEAMHDYLYEKNRGNISVLVLIGGWLESLYIATTITSVDVIEHFFEEYPELIERIGVQKMALDNMAILLDVYKNKPGMEQLVKDFAELREIYSGVKITYIYAEPKISEVNGVLVIKDKSETKVEISEEQLHEILLKVKEIRNHIVS